MREVLAANPWLAAATAALLAVAFALVAHRIGGAVLRRATRSSVLLSPSAAR